MRLEDAEEAEDFQPWKPNPRMSKAAKAPRIEHLKSRCRARKLS